MSDGPMIRHEPIKLLVDGLPVNGVLVLASPNRRSLAVEIGNDRLALINHDHMPAGHYEDIWTRRRVQVVEP